MKTRTPNINCQIARSTVKQEPSPFDAPPPAFAAKPLFSNGQPFSCEESSYVETFSTPPEFGDDSLAPFSGSEFLDDFEGDLTSLGANDDDVTRFLDDDSDLVLTASTSSLHSLMKPTVMGKRKMKDHQVSLISMGSFKEVHAAIVVPASRGGRVAMGDV